jgi:hypothetical protein
MLAAEPEAAHCKQAALQEVDYVAALFVSQSRPSRQSRMRVSHQQPPKICQLEATRPY